MKVPYVMPSVELGSCIYDLGFRLKDSLWAAFVNGN